MFLVENLKIQIKKEMKRKIKLSNQEIGSLIDKFYVHSIPVDTLKDEEVLTDEQFY